MEHLALLPLLFYTRINPTELSPSYVISKIAILYEYQKWEKSISSGYNNNFRTVVVEDDDPMMPDGKKKTTTPPPYTTTTRLLLDIFWGKFNILSSKCMCRPISFSFVFFNSMSYYIIAKYYNTDL